MSILSRKLTKQYERLFEVLSYVVVCGSGFMVGLLLNFLGVFK